MTNQDEVYYCGRCRRQQPTSTGEKCKSCGRITVSWYTNRESEKNVQQKWKDVNPRG